MKFRELTDQIIGGFFRVYNTLGYGFLEKVYENALVIELENSGLVVEAQKPIQVHYGESIVGEYFADLLVGNSVIVEIKAAKTLNLEHEAQLLNYLKATKIEVGLLLNFGPKPEVKRRILDHFKS